VNERTVVAHVGDDVRYAAEPPFHPSGRYPEYPFQHLSECNPVYESVRGCFVLAGLDAGRYGTASWNPLGGLIRPGETVLLKPNLVRERHPTDPNGWQYVLTNGSIIRAVADYVWLALESRGRIIIADAPQTDSSFAQIRGILGFDHIRDFYAERGLRLDVIDLRKEEWLNRGDVIVRRDKLEGDPEGYVAFDLRDGSEFVTHHGSGSYYGADYDAGEVNRHHCGGRHEYLIARSAIKADVMFSLPKLKTHKKAGVTVSLKNLVGVNGDKNWLPHHTEAGNGHSGDEHPAPDFKHRFERAAVKPLRMLSLKVPVAGTLLHRMARRLGREVFGDTERVIRSGNWWGNDTIWRMCLDLNKIILYGNEDGSLRSPVPENRKRHYVLVDSVIAGQGRGPTNPDPYYAGMVVFGLHPASADAACAWLMGFDPDRIPIVRNAFRCHRYAIADWDWRDIRLVSNRPEWNAPLPDVPYESTFHFEPHFGWAGWIERTGDGSQKSNDAGSRKTLSKTADLGAAPRL
jgi:uncharacterized protein (DUF362 family)